MVEQLTASQERWVTLAAQHADDFATRAAQHDRDNSFPFENYEAMKASGYTSMPIPEELGGGGASLLDICYAQERLARGDGPTALAVNMHLGLPWVMTDLYRAGDEHVVPLLERIAKERLIVFGAITDPAVDSFKGATGLGYTTVKATKVPGGFRINGRKAFGTNSPVGDLFGTTAIYDDPTEGEVNCLFIIPKDTPGLRCQHDWDTLGMRASASHSWVLDNVFVDDEAIIRRKPWEWDHYVRGIWAWHGGSFCSIYLGIARAARDFAIAYTQTRTRVPFRHPESYYPGHQFLAAEMDIGLKAAWAFQTAMAARLSTPPRDYQTHVDAVAMQHFCMRTAVDVVNKAIDMVGGAALARRLPLERYYRDVRSGPVHPIGGYDALEMIGKHAFGLPRDSDPRWV
jgi:alkylation response protein AidB-like acyl-CoA dehydrogenase